MKTFNPKKTTTVFENGQKTTLLELIEIDELGNYIMKSRETGKILQYSNVTGVRIQIVDNIWVHQERNGGTYGVEFERKVTRTGAASRGPGGKTFIGGDYREEGGRVHMEYAITPHAHFIPDNQIEV